MKVSLRMQHILIQATRCDPTNTHGQRTTHIYRSKAWNGEFELPKLESVSLFFDSRINASFTVLFPAVFRCNRSKTSASFLSGVPNTEKEMKARRLRRRAFIVSRCLEPLMKNEARVFDMASQTCVGIR